MANIEKYVLKNGESYYKFQVYTGVNPSTGKQSTTTRSGFRTKREAKIELTRIKAQVDAGTFFSVKKQEDYTFKEVYELWKEGYQNTVESSTLLKVEQMFKNRLLPAFGKYLIAKIDSDMIQKQVNEWKEYTSVDKWLSHASRVFTYAMGKQIIQSNPCDFVIKPKKVKSENKEKHFYETEELKQLSKALDDWENLQGRAMLRLLAFTGLRQSEATALTWRDIDIDNKTVNVNKAIGRREIPDQNKTELYLKPPKNEPSVRITTIDEKTLEYLLDWAEFNESQWVFINNRGKWLSPSKPRKWLRSVAKKADIQPIAVHKLRHTHASLLFEAGATLKDIQERLGHGDIFITAKTYTHHTQHSRDHFAEQFSNHIDF